MEPNRMELNMMGLSIPLQLVLSMHVKQVLKVDSLLDIFLLVKLKRNANLNSLELSRLELVL